jgi:hypothetical protein
MCHFKSAIVVRDAKSNGGFRVLLSPWTESHSDLILLHNLRDDGRLRFARVEFTPASIGGAYLPGKYTLRIDEERTPDWFDAEMKERVADHMRAYIKSIIVTGEVALLIGGQFIVAPGAKVQSAKTMVANVVLGSIGTVCDSAQIGSVCGSAQIGTVCGSAKIGYVYGSAQVGSVYDSAKIDSVYDSAKIGTVYGSAQIGYVYGSAKIDRVCDSAQIGTVSGSAKIDSVCGSAKIGSVYDSAQIVNDKRSAKETSK